jgi:hypothetical protein
MVNAKTEAVPAPTQAQMDFDKVLNSGSYTESAKSLGKTIFKKLTTIGADTKIADLEVKISEALLAGNKPLYKSLFAELNQIEQDQEKLKDHYKKIRGNDKFETVVQAWGLEFHELACSLAVEIIKSASVAQLNANAGGDKGTSGKLTAKAFTVKTPPKTYIVTQEKTGKTAELPLRRGSAKPSKDKEVYELLGFKFSEDGSLTETGFKYKDKSGKQVVEAEATRKALLAAIENGGFAGFTAVLKG